MLWYKVTMSADWVARLAKAAVARAIPIAVAACLLSMPVAVLWVLSSYLMEASWLQDNGRRAVGTITDGVSGTSLDNTPYCKEEVEFNDDQGKRRYASRACVGKPEKGAKVTVYYVPDEPSRSYVEGDNRMGEYIFGGGILGVYALIVLGKAGVRFIGRSEGRALEPGSIGRFRNRARREGSAIR